MNHDAIDGYLNLLWTQLQYDWSVFTTGWVLYTVLPALLYLCFFCIKWWVLLVPITLPVTILAGKSPGSIQRVEEVKKENDLEKALTTLLKG